MAKERPKKDLIGAQVDNMPTDKQKPLYEANTQPGGMADDLTFMKMDEMANSIPQRAANEIAMLEGYKAQEEQNKLKPQKIGEKEVREAAEILRKYKEGKARLEAKIISNEEYWKLRQWNYQQNGNEERGYKPATAWLWSCIASRHADMMDSYPTCNFLARQQDDKAEAKMLSAVIPVVLEQNRYEETYSDIAWYLLKNGGCVQGVFWDGSKHNGLGDISIKKIDILNIFWEPGVTDIQKSENVFTVELCSNKVLEQKYPQTRGKLAQKDITVAKYLHDENINTDGKSIVVDWYYKTEYNGRKAVQYCKFVNGVVLYATENDTAQPMQQQMDMMTGIPVMIPDGEPMSVRGLYDHALYPFVFQDLYPIEDSLVGYGLTDIGRDTQGQIDVMNKAVTDNAVVTASPRYFIKNTGAVNEKEFCDITKSLVHVEGNIGDEDVRPMDVVGLPSTVVTELQNKIDELKYITSNQDANNGVAPSGVTAASAIAALQETAGKNARDSNKTIHRAYREVCYMVLELIRQFYDTPRTFRIAPDALQGTGMEQYIAFSNQGIKEQPQSLNGIDMGIRIPEFDIEVTSEKASPYKKMEQNELALNFYQQGFFNPQMADQAIACLQMMDFSHKEDVIQRIQINGTMQQMLLQFEQLALTLAQKYEPQTAEQIGQMVLSMGGQQPIAPGGDVNLDGSKEEHPYVQRARANAAASTQAD